MYRCKKKLLLPAGRIDYEVLEKIANRILAEVPNVNRDCYDLSPKPPATIEME